MKRKDEYGIPETDAEAARAGKTAEKDFAEDEFWDRTDEDEAAAPKPAKAAAARPATGAVQGTSKSGNGKQTNGKPSNRPATPPAVGAPDDSEFDLPPLSQDELSHLHDTGAGGVDADPDHADAVHGDAVHADAMQTDAGLPPAAGRDTGKPPAKRRRFRIPFLMPLIVLAMGVALTAIWYFIHVHAQIAGTMTFQNLSLTPGTQEAMDFEAGQRRLLDDQTRVAAANILGRDNPGVAQGFLASAEPFAPVAASVSINSSSQGATPQTLLTFSFAGSDGEGDRLRTLALLEALSDRNAPQVEINRRLRDRLQRAEQIVNDAEQKRDALKRQMTDLQQAIESAPPAQQLAIASQHRAALEAARLSAQDAVRHDREEIDRLQAMTSGIGASTQPVADDAQLKQMRLQLADLSAEIDSARSDQLTNVSIARQKLEIANQQFDEKIAAANTLLGSGSQLRQFVDSAMDSQSKARDLINMLIVDGEDLEQQLEDTRRDIEDLIQTQQAEKWAEDPELQQDRDNLQSAQHRYNANVGQGITDPRILDPLQKEIDRWTAEVKRRQNLIGADPGEMRVEASINGVIDSLRKKLSKEKQQTDAVLNPLERQLADLDPIVTAMPSAQQDLAREIRQRLETLNQARQSYAQTVGEDQIAPSSKVNELKGRIAELRVAIAAREADLSRQAAIAASSAHAQEVAAAQARLQSDQIQLSDATKAVESGLGDYDELHNRQVRAQSAQQKKMFLMEEQQAAATELENAKRDLDEKQSAADHAFDIKPIVASDVVAVTPTDPRMLYSMIVLAVGLLAFALAAYMSPHAPRQAVERADKVAKKLDSLLPLAQDDDHTATA